jgi:hypothetical protein
MANLTAEASHTMTMPKRISIYVLLMVTLGVFLNHFSIEHKENGYLLMVDGREVDAIGIVQDKWVKLTRNCSRVRSVDTQMPERLTLLQLIRDYSPPSSESAHVVQAVTTGKWALVEVKFNDLLPAVVLIDQTLQPPQIVPNAIWSGETHPWRPAHFVRQYISNKVPQVPSDLLDCFEPQLKNL